MKKRIYFNRNNEYFQLINGDSIHEPEKGIIGFRMNIACGLPSEMRTSAENRLIEYLDLCCEDDCYWNKNSFEYVRLAQCFNAQDSVNQFYNYGINHQKNSNVSSNLKEALDFAQQNDDIIICYSDYTTTAGCLIATITHALNEGLKIRKCKNCGRYFFPFVRSDEQYCDFPSPQNNKKTCKQFNKAEKEKIRLELNDVAKLEKKIYNLLVQRHYYDEGSFADEVINFRNEKSEWKKKLRKGIASKIEYVEWLNSHYKTKNKPQS